ncbi:MAG: hypothetical protein JJE04_05405 [Acidobacteriia bacterium]|nr:hypothetical protein [Terriglobia bacterium]
MPYLSVVVTTRNDDHGGSQISRTQTFLNALVAQCNRHRIPTELIFVEWNPPADRPPLAQALRWPESREFCSVRILRVPPSIHARYQHGEALPLYQMIAKNVGIRRANGEYILATNIDILFSDELMRHIGARRLEKNKMYRIDRTDVEADVPVDGSIDEQLDYCRQHLIRAHIREATVSLTREGLRRPEENDIVEIGSGIFLGEGWHSLENLGGRSFRWMQPEGELIVQAAGPENGIQHKQLLVDAEPAQHSVMRTWTLQLQDENGDVVGEGAVEGMTRVVFNVSIRNGARNVFRLVQAGADTSLIPVVPNDARFLNMRIFHCDWHGGGPVPAPRDILDYPARENLPHAILDYVTGNRQPDEHPRIESPAEPFEDLLPTPYRSGNPTAVGVHNRLFSYRFGVVFGPGFYAPEVWDGILYFWCMAEAHMIVRQPQGCPGDLRLLVETGPGFGFEPFTLEVREGNGELLLRETVERQAWIQVPASPTAELTRELQFSATGQGKAIETPNDPRPRVFRVLDYGWGDRLGMIRETVQADLPKGTVKLGWGWTRQPERGAFLAMSGAEFIVQPRGDEGARLRIELEEAETTARRLEVRDGTGKVLTEFTGAGTHWDLPPASSRIGVYRLFSSTAEAGSPAARIRGMGWLPRAAPKARRLPHLHTNACGDFTLLHREHWLNLRGYAEFDMYSMNLDSLFCLTAFHAGIEEEVWAAPMRIYHIEHGLGSGWTPEGQAQLFSRLAKRGIGWMDWAEVLALGFQMNRLRSPMIFCGQDWGLGKDSLEEVLL